MRDWMNTGLNNVGTKKWPKNIVHCVPIKSSPQNKYLSFNKNLFYLYEVLDVVTVHVKKNDLLV